MCSSDIRSKTARFAVIADDLTGVCDSAVVFAERGIPVEVLFEKCPLLPREGVWAVSTESRDIDINSAIKRIQETVARVESDTELFKKVDSVFRGNSFAEIRATIESFSFDLAILSPAYPQMGRKVRNGILHIKDIDGESTIDLREGLDRAGISFTILNNIDRAEMSSRLKDIVKSGPMVVLCDVESPGEMQEIVVVVRQLCQRILWIGSGGLAHALASELPEKKPQHKSYPGEGRIVLWVGSDHPVTKKQLDFLRENAEVYECAVEDFSAVSSNPHVIFRVTRDLTTEAQIKSAFSLLSSSSISCCLMTGGYTAALVCRALGVRSLTLSGEFAPGLPQGIAMGELSNQFPVILKSGGFGGEDVFLRLFQQLEFRKELV